MKNPVKVMMVIIASTAKTFFASVGLIWLTFMLIAYFVNPYVPIGWHTLVSVAAGFMVAMLNYKILK